jgi:hypothetical protein
MIDHRIAFSGFLLLAVTSPALAQDATRQAETRLPPSQIGKILEIEGPPGSVIVVRGAQAYALQAGDALFKGDRVVTRINGSVTLSGTDCERRLEPTTSVVVDDDLCRATLASVEDGSPLLQISGGLAAAGIGATPLLLPGLLGTGAAAAAVAGGLSSSATLVSP